MSDRSDEMDGVVGEERSFEALGRTAGAALRTSPPPGLLDAALATGRRRRRARTAVAVVAPAIVVLGVIAWTAAGPSSSTGPESPSSTPASTIGSVPTTDEPGPASTTDSPTTTSAPAVSTGPLHDPGSLVRPMAVSADGSGTLTWQDPLDAAESWADVEQVSVYSLDTQPHWRFELAGQPTPAADLEPGLLITYGLVLDTTGDGVADYVVGIDNDAPEPGDFRVWVTDLATGETDEQVGPPYGYPVEFSHPDEQSVDVPPGAPYMLFTFLGDSVPADLIPEDVSFYVWTSVTRDGEVIATDFAPDNGWITTDTQEDT